MNSESINTQTEKEGVYTEYLKENDHEFYLKYKKYKRKYKKLVKLANEMKKTGKLPSQNPQYAELSETSKQITNNLLSGGEKSKRERSSKHESLKIREPVNTQPPVKSQEKQRSRPSETLTGSNNIKQHKSSNSSSTNVQKIEVSHEKKSRSGGSSSKRQSELSEKYTALLNK